MARESRPTRVESAQPPPGRRLPRWLRLPIRVIVMVYLGLTVVLATFQSQMIFPGQASQGRPEAVVVPGPGLELVRLETAAGDRVVALFGAAEDPEGKPLADAPARPTLLFFYGNGNCLADMADLHASFRRLGVNVLIPEYVGYGMSGGTAGEPGCYATADAALAHLKARKDVDPKRFVVGGWSLGSAVAIDLARREPMAGVMAFSGFTSMVDMARKNFPILPSGLLLRHRFESESKLRHIRCPALIGHGRLDRLIPYAMADRLAAAAKGPVTRFEVEKADHGDFFDIGRAQVLGEMQRFLDGLGTAIPPDQVDPGTSRAASSRADSSRKGSRP